MSTPRRYPITLHAHGSIVRMEIHRPPVNAIDLPTAEALEAALIEVSKREASALVFTGAGACFSAGLDLKAVATYDEAQLQHYAAVISRVFARVFLLPMPTVAAINGHCIAGGLIVALACDTRVAAEGNALFGLSETRVGVPFPASAMAVVKAGLSPQVARRLVLEGRNVGADRALAQGMIDELCPREALLERALALAEDLGSSPRAVYQKNKRMLNPDVFALMERVLEEEGRMEGEWLDPETEKAAASVLAERRRGPG